MARDDYDPDDDRRGGEKENALTKKAGPLPVWGWAVVAVASVFLYRKIASPASQAANAVGANAQSVPYQTAGGGGVYVIPTGSSSSGSSGTSTTLPPNSSTTVGPYEPVYPLGGPGAATGQCPPGTILIQGPNGHTCATAQQAIGLGNFLAGLTK